MPRRAIATTVAILVITMAGACAGDRHERGPLEVPSAADAQAGEHLVEAFGCGTCHRIPGIPTANGRVGPSLAGFGRQFYIAGAVPNNYDNLVQWLIDPESIEPGTLMPSFGLNEQLAGDIAAYLATLQ